MERTHVTVKLENGNSFDTEINLSPEDAVNYYLGQMWEMSDEKSYRCTEVIVH